MQGQSELKISSSIDANMQEELANDQPVEDAAGLGDDLVPGLLLLPVLPKHPHKGSCPPQTPPTLSRPFRWTEITTTKTGLYQFFLIMHNLGRGVTVYDHAVVGGIAKTKTLLTFFVHEHDLRNLAWPGRQEKVKTRNVDEIKTRQCQCFWETWVQLGCELCPLPPSQWTRPPSPHFFSAACWTPRLLLAPVESSLCHRPCPRNWKNI